MMRENDTMVHKCEYSLQIMYNHIYLLLLTVFVEGLRDHPALRFRSPPTRVKTSDETTLDIIYPRKYGKYIIK
jgi:hypothetical protein